MEHMLSAARAASARGVDRLEGPMKQLVGTGVALAIALLGAAAPALAHHSLQSEYDINQSIT